MNSTDTDSRQFWAYAGSFGALWGALEATLGSFLHALKVPFAGVLLASLGAALLIALRLLVPRPGILVATGAVCAAVKLSSPATDLVGPAVGILIESCLVELVTLPLGANAVSALLGGGLAASWAICQKVLKQIVLYGEPIVSLYKELLKRGSTMLGLSTDGGLRLVLLFVGLMASFGAGAAYAGLRAGRRAGALSIAAIELEAEAKKPDSARPEPGREPVLRGRAVFVAFLAVVQLVALVVLARPWHALLLTALLTVTLIACGILVRRIGSLQSWAFAFAVLAVLGLLLGPKDTWHGRLSLDGGSMAVTMIARAVGLVILCQALLAALPPLHTSPSPFARAVEAALDALPRVTNTMGAAMRRRQAEGIRSPVRLVLGLLDDAVSLASTSARGTERNR